MSWSRIFWLPSNNRSDMLVARKFTKKDTKKSGLLLASRFATLFLSAHHFWSHWVGPSRFAEDLALMTSNLPDEYLGVGDEARQIYKDLQQDFTTYVYNVMLHIYIYIYTQLICRIQTPCTTFRAWNQFYISNLDRIFSQDLSHQIVSNPYQRCWNWRR